MSLTIFECLANQSAGSLSLSLFVEFVAVVDLYSSVHENNLPFILMILYSNELSPRDRERDIYFSLVVFSF